MKNQIITAIKNFDIIKLEVLLDDAKTYMDVSKSVFLETLAKEFESAKEGGCHSFDDVLYGVCKSAKGVNDGMTGYFGSICASDFGFIVPGLSVQTVPFLPVN